MLTNCPQCGRPFNKTSNRICEACLERADREFEVVSDYLRGHNPMTVAEISEGTGVPEDRVLEMLQSGRLTVASLASGFFYPCTRCEAPIHVGRFCNRCSKQIGLELGTETADEDVSTMSDFTRMRFRENRGR